MLVYERGDKLISIVFIAIDYKSMKRVLINVVAVMLVVFMLFSLTACGKKDESKKEEAKKIKVSTELGKVGITVDSPKVNNDAGEEVAKYSFVEEAPENAEYTAGSKYLVTDKAVFSFETSSYTYQTGIKYKETYGEVEPSYKGFVDYIKSDIYTGTIKDMEELTINGREAFKTDYKYGTGSGELHGYYYYVNVDDCIGGYLKIVVTTAEGETGDAAAMIADSSVQELINSLVIESK